MPDGVLGFTRFGKDGVKAVVISETLDQDKSQVAARRVRTTIAHEGGHGLLHSHLFALDDIPLHLFDRDSHSGDQILCRDVHGDDKKIHRYDGRWWEVQANRAMGSLLCPKPLVLEAIKPHLSSAGLLDTQVLEESPREAAVRALADIFDVNPVVTRIRLADLYPTQTGQMHL
jgi:Zn-dependent peptidase ImmA (M78 family)